MSLLKISALQQSGPVMALLAAVLFGASTPLAKWLLQDMNPWLLAGVLYLGSGLGMTLLYKINAQPRSSIPGTELIWLIAAIACGGLIAPVLLMVGLTNTGASNASLLLNAEAVFTALIAWCVFRENVDRRIAIGLFSIVAGAVVLSWPHDYSATSLKAPLAILGACLAWGIDNNLTRKVALTDARRVAGLKGLFAGATNITLAMLMGATIPAWSKVSVALLTGWLCYGVSLALFVIALRSLGTARTGAYFSVAPFFGAMLSVILFGEPLTTSLILAGVLMAIGVWLHVTEHHSHLHTHEPLEHTHEHEHDEHHQHHHDGLTVIPGKHSHWHRHTPLTHSHPHYPDSHHNHSH